ncbi:hypothetical protein GBF38_002515 [Nibea albiflora]|uniref:Uncharacterized protein n=1 Tax=Nibea albiflora TaxID=240163 RepID=A0ACB7EEN5_NIBAL|nr:hypothetical protein GBF38_002515 [Nibea albiflora]
MQDHSHEKAVSSVPARQDSRPGSACLEAQWTKIHMIQAEANTPTDNHPQQFSLLYGAVTATFYIWHPAGHPEIKPHQLDLQAAVSL